MHASTSLVLAMLKLVLEVFFCEGVFASKSGGSPSHSWSQSSPCFASFSSRYFSASWTVRSHFDWDKSLFSFVMVFTVTDLGGVFHLRTVGRSNDAYSGCTTAFNLFFTSGKSSAFNCVRCALPEKSSGPYSSGSDFAFVFWLFNSSGVFMSFPCVSSTYLPRTCPVLLLLNHALQRSNCLILLFP